MKKKSLFTVLLGVTLALCLCVASVAFIGGTSARAEEETAERLPDFTEDFESYETGNFIEETSGFADKWDNNILRGGEPLGMDAHLRGIARIEEETDGNKVLAINNTTGNDSFFYIGPKGDYRVKNFTASMKVKFLTAGVPERSWVGFSFRKKSNVHYTGTNNLLFNAQRYANSDIITGQPNAVIGGGSETNLITARDTELFKPSVLTVTNSNYHDPALAPNSDSSDFAEIKLVANEREYRLYANDNLIANCKFDVPSYDYYGYLSINACQANIKIDDFKVQVQDATLPSEPTKLAAPEVTVDTENKKLIIKRNPTADGYRISYGTVSTIWYKTEYDLSKLAAGDYEIKVTCLPLDVLEHAESDPTVVNYTATGSAANPDGSNNSKPAKSGCNGSIGYASVFAAMALFAAIGVTLIVKKRKGERI